MALSGEQLTVEATTKTNTRRWLHLSQKEVMCYLMVLPAMLVILLVVFLPIAQTFWFSLHDIDKRMGDRPEPFIGLQNYINAFTDPDTSTRLFDAFGFTTRFAVVSVGLEFVFGLGVALVLNRNFRGQGLVRAIVLIPWSITTVVVAQMWGLIYNSEFGILNSTLKGLGIIDKDQLWTANHDLTFWAVVVADTWKSTPFVALILLSGLQFIPADLYEAATVDGASVWQKFLHITLPALRPTILVALVFRTIDALRIFDLVYVLTEGGFGTESLNYMTYQELFRKQNFGFGSSLAIITFLYLLVVSLIYIKLLGNREEERN
jgi:ABC-type sugar transport system permease subunit